MRTIAENAHYCQVNNSGLSSDEACSTKSFNVDLEAARRFLTALSEDDDRFHFLTVADERERARTSKAHTYFGSFGDLADKLVADNADGRAVFVRINAGGTKNAEITERRAVFFDADKSDARPHDLIRDVGIDPHFIIESSPGKFHLYWMIEPGLTEIEFRSIQTGMANQYGGDTSMADCSQAMRLVGFYHQKNRAAPFRSRILEATHAQPLTLEVVRKKFPRGKAADASASTHQTVVAAMHRVIEVDDVTRIEIESALFSLNADDRPTWIGAGMDLRELGDIGKEPWMRWSATSPKFDVADAERTWESFRDSRSGYRNIFNRARAVGWIAPPRVMSAEDKAAIEELGRSLISRGDVVRRPAIKLSSLDYAPLPPELLEIPGELRAIYEWILASAYQPLVEGSLASALTIASVAMGQIYRSTQRQRTNIYVGCVAETGHGKDHPQACARLILQEGGLGDKIGGSGLSSDTAMLRHLAEQHGHACYVIDEFDGLLRSTLGGNAQSHQYMIANYLQTLYASADSREFKGKDYADPKERPTSKIEYPCLSLLGFTTPDKFYENLASKDVSSGFLNRFIVLESPSQRMQGNEDPIDNLTVPSRFKSWIETLHDPRYIAERSSLGLPANGTNYVTVSYEEKATHLFRVFKAEVDTLQASMVAEQNNLHRALVRVGENAHRLALICAGSKRPSSPLIDEECAAWSIAFMRHFGLQLVHAIRSRMAGSDFERWVKAIYDFIARAGENGTNKSHMQQYCATYKALDQRQVAAVLVRLISSGMVEQCPGARKSVRYVAMDPNIDVDDC